MGEKNPRKPAAKARKKKPWEPPRVKSGRLFESNSLACSKNQDPQNAEMCSADIQLS
jgi:hypothetical protein